MKPKLACADFSFPLLPHNRALQLISILGFKGVDIGIFGADSHVLIEGQNGNPIRIAKELKNCVQDVGLEFADIYLIGSADFKALSPNHPDPRERQRSREQFQCALEFVVSCDARHLTGVPGIHWEFETRQESFNRCVEELAWRFNQAKKCGITFSIEPHSESIVSEPAEALNLVGAIDGLTLTLDCAHFLVQGISDFPIEPLIRHSTHLHARGARPFSLQCSMNENTIDFIRLMRAMRETRYSGYVSVEYVRSDSAKCHSVDILSETILMRDLLLQA